MVKKAVILAAGTGTRLEPLTETRPKCLIQVMGKSFLYYILNNLKHSGYTDIAIVVGYKKEMIKQFCKEYNFKVTFIEQKKQLGTGDAIKTVKEFVGNDNFIVLMSDNLYARDDLRAIRKKDNLNYVVGYKHRHPEKFGVLIQKRGFLKKIVEKPKKPESNLINTGLYKLTPEIFQILDKIKRTKRREYEITDALTSLAKEDKVKVIQAKDFWFDFGYPWDIFKVNEFILENTKEYRKGSISKDAHLEGKVIVEKGTEIKAGVNITGPVYIGKNCNIGPNCYIRGHTSLSDNVHVGAASEVKNSIIMNDTNVPHHNYVGDSIIGAHTNLGSGTKIANLRHDDSNVKITIKGKKIDSERRKIGAIIGDNVKVGINASIMPGAKIGSNCMVGPSVILYEDLPKEKCIFLKQQHEIH
jgi:bifunctional UDP-N-acetylglucosamine pyrophosphorylase/glucosamine-1-phosphate N-acetyltransferase